MKDFFEVSNSNSDKENGLIKKGYLISDQYKIVKLIGRGGMADVYLADDLSNKRKVAIKVLKAELTDDKEFIRRFDAEAIAVSKLKYQNIVDVYDVGTQGKFRYIVFEFIDGISLKELIEKNGSLAYDVAVPLAIQIGLALDNAHKNGIIHRDIKPHNILITSDFVAKVTDFGIARTISSNTVTLSGRNTMGSVHYFSPEQARGGIVGEQSDIYSLGIVLYEMLTGQVPFDGDSPVSVALKHVQNKVTPPKDINPEIPEGLNKIVLKSLQKSCDFRYKNAKEIVNELDAFIIDPKGDYGFIQEYDENEKTTVISAVDRDSNFHKLKELEYMDKKVKRHKIKERIIIVFSVLLIVGIISGSAYYAVGWIKTQITPPVQNYHVENFIGKNIDDVKSKLESENINYEIFYEESSTVAQGIVFYQSIQTGMELRPGGASTITFRVSSGQDTLRIGDYVGKNYVLAQNELIQVLGLEVKIVKEQSGEYAKDYIIGTIPSAGNDIAKGGEITLVVSDGLIDVQIPDVIGMARPQVLKILEEKHLKIRSDAFIGEGQLEDDKQYLIGIEPAPGTTVAALTGVIITFGSYDDYVNSIMPSPTPTLSPTPEVILEPTPEDDGE